MRHEDVTKSRSGSFQSTIAVTLEAITELEAVVDDLYEIVALVEKEEGLTTDDADDADGKKPGGKSSVKSV